MKKILLILLFTGSFISYGQKDNISLPSSKAVLDTIPNKPHYSIYITNNEELYFENKRLRFWDQIASSILEMERLPIGKVVTSIIIYADKKIPYYTVQRLRDEIGKVWNGMVYLKGSSFGDNLGLSFFQAGSFRKSRRKKRYGDYINNLEIIYTTNEKNGTKSTPKLKGEEPFPGVLAVWQNNFSLNFFKLDSTFINQSLKDLKFNSIVIDSKNSFSFKNKIHSFNDTILLKKLVEDNDLIFIKTKYITYEEYFKAISKIQERRYYSPNSHHGVLRKPFLLEIHYIFEENLKEKGILLFD